jgi:hypothetical protein
LAQLALGCQKDLTYQAFRPQLELELEPHPCLVQEGQQVAQV